MKTLDHIPTSRMARAGQLVKTGVKVGGNYVSYWGEKMLNPSVSKDKLHQNNAADIYEGLQTLKGSALKVAQMLSMEKNVLPAAYSQQFAMAQYSVPPMSAPLVRQTFKKYTGAYPENLYESFTPEAVHAASIGQVHLAVKDGKKFAVKIQYPGVADSIQSDLALVKPFALRMFNLQGQDTDKYFKEVEQKLLEETDYRLELVQSIAHSQACSHIEGLRFPTYYPDYSSSKVLCMEWVDAQHLSEFCASPAREQYGHQVGQALWDFYLFQMHQLRAVHADPHPGNFLVDAQGQLVAIDFGCIKHIPEDFYVPYFELAKPEILQDATAMLAPMRALELIRSDDTPEEVAYCCQVFQQLLGLFSKPLQAEVFDFADAAFFQELAQMGEFLAKDPKLRAMNGNRGAVHFLYINRTLFGLYHLLHDVKAKVHTKAYEKYLS